MRTILFSSQTYDRDSFTAAAQDDGNELHFQPARLTLDTAALAHDHEVVCPFINDDLSAPVLEQLAAGGTQERSSQPVPPRARIISGSTSQRA